MIHNSTGATILGAGEASHPVLQAALEMAPLLVCADGGAHTAIRFGHNPDYIIGDMDSLAISKVQGMIDSSRVKVIKEQDSTDFDKCVCSLDAPYFIAVGVTSPRLDHALATLNVLVRHKHKKIAILTETDFCFLGPPQLSLSLPIGGRLSLFPMNKVRGKSSGLHWPIDGLEFSPSGRIGTSNRVSDKLVELQFTEPGMLVTVDAELADQTLSSMIAADRWDK